MWWSSLLTLTPTFSRPTYLAGLLPFNLAIPTTGAVCGRWHKSVARVELTIHVYYVISRFSRTCSIKEQTRL